MRKNIKFYSTEYQLLKKIRSVTLGKARANGDRKKAILRKEISVPACTAGS